MENIHNYFVSQCIQAIDADSNGDMDLANHLIDMMFIDFARGVAKGDKSCDENIAKLILAISEEHLSWRHEYE